MRVLLKNPALRRYWFRTSSSTGFGVTAFSRTDAEELLAAAGLMAYVVRDLEEVVEDVDVSTLDQSHIWRHMGPTLFRGVWYPCLNLGPHDTKAYQVRHNNGCT